MDRLGEIKKKFCILNDWKITMSSDQGLQETPYTGQCNINSGKHIAIIYPWHTNELEPSDYILHEILHIAMQAVLTDYEYRELFVQDLCTQFKEKDQEIERLRKEREWLVEQMVFEKCGGTIPLLTAKEWRNKIINRMQQALKER